LAAGAAVAYLQVTGAMHPNDYLLRERLDKDGFAFAPAGLSRDEKTREIKSEAVSHSGLGHIHEFAGFVLGEIEKKAAKSHPAQTTLIVQCTLYVFDPAEWNTLVAIVQRRLPPEHRQRFREIFVCEHTLFWSDTL